MVTQRACSGLGWLSLLVWLAACGGNAALQPSATTHSAPGSGAQALPQLSCQAQAAEDNESFVVRVDDHVLVLPGAMETWRVDCPYTENGAATPFFGQLELETGMLGVSLEQIACATNAPCNEEFLTIAAVNFANGMSRRGFRVEMLGQPEFAPGHPGWLIGTGAPNANDRRYAVHAFAGRVLDGERLLFVHVSWVVTKGTVEKEFPTMVAGLFGHVDEVFEPTGAETP